MCPSEGSVPSPLANVLLFLLSPGCVHCKTFPLRPRFDGVDETRNLQVLFGRGRRGQAPGVSTLFTSTLLLEGQKVDDPSSNRSPSWGFS